jgi:hypothetical protein
MLTPKQSRLIAFLLTAPTVRAACRKAGVSERAYRAWKGRPDFRDALAAARRDALAAAVGLLHGLAAPAARALRAALRADRAGDRIRAAMAIIDRAVAGAELLDILPRLEALEARKPS